MKPLNTTFRKYKDHKAAECSMCSERVLDNRSHIRFIAKADINKEIIIDSTIDDSWTKRPLDDLNWRLLADLDLEDFKV